MSPFRIIAYLTSLIIGTAIAFKWDDIVIALKGKKLAVLGARGVGKTHLVQFLSTGSIPSVYNPTVGVPRTSSRRFQLKDLDLNVKESRDVDGHKLSYGDWKELHDQADVVFYLLRADQLIAGNRDTEARVRDDLKHIGGWLESRNPRPRFFLIGTHCDCDPEFNSTQADKVGNYTDKFRRIPVVVELVARAGGSQQAKVVLGSMKTLENTEALVYKIFKQMTS